MRRQPTAHHIDQVTVAQTVRCIGHPQGTEIGRVCDNGGQQRGVACTLARDAISELSSAARRGAPAEPRLTSRHPISSLCPMVPARTRGARHPSDCVHERAASESVSRRTIKKQCIHWMDSSAIP